MSNALLLNHVNGEWVLPKSGQTQAVINPATQEVLAEVVMSNAADVNAATEIAATTYQEWRKVPSGERIQYLFKLKTLLEDNVDALARTITMECGKTYAESVGELRRAIENVEVACGIPSMMMGSNVEDIARGIDEHMIRQSLGVVAIISPFNFPGMIPFWFLPYAIATGNTVILKPSERVPMTMKLAMELIEKTGLPKGVVNLVNGGKEAVDAILDHPSIRAI
ncbi:MAG: aldehyde dehydrogenase family protein, partial [Gammaproteobacteria bacterium]|nr:aldehyde dehydrogenase family protein [Gammaproteobacteria bacterium]